MATTIAALRWAALMAAAGLLAGCGYFGGSHPAAGAHSPPSAQSAKPADPAAKALAGMVEAVGPSSSQPPIELRFSIRNRPEVGRDDEVDYALIPQVGGLDSLRVVFGALNGLQVSNHGVALAATKPASGVPLFGSVSVRPDAAGLFTLTAAVAVESSDADSVVWTFTIPVIAAQPPGSATAQAANPP